MRYEPMGSDLLIAAIVLISALCVLWSLKTLALHHEAAQEAIARRALARALRQQYEARLREEERIQETIIDTY